MFRSVVGTPTEPETHQCVEIRLQATYDQTVRMADHCNRLGMSSPPSIITSLLTRFGIIGLAAFQRRSPITTRPTSPNARRLGGHGDAIPIQWLLPTNIILYLFCNAVMQL